MGRNTPPHGWCMELYKICYSIGFNRRQVLVADYCVALRLLCLVADLCRYGTRYDQVRFYEMGSNGKWEEDEERSKYY